MVYGCHGHCSWPSWFVAVIGKSLRKQQILLSVVIGGVHLSCDIVRWFLTDIRLLSISGLHLE